MIICWDTFFDEKICNFFFCWFFRNLFDQNGFVRMYSDRKYQKNNRDILIHPTKISGVLCNFWFMIVLTSKNLVVKKKFSQDLFETQLDKKRQQDVGKIFWTQNHRQVVATLTICSFSMSLSRFSNFLLSSDPFSSIR